MADQRIQSTEEMVGAGHATKADTLNRALLVEHNNEGKLKFHTLVEQTAAPGTLADEGAIYAKDVGGQTHFFYRRESGGAEIQITSGTGLNVPAAGLPKGYRQGWKMSNNTVDPVNDVDVSAGKGRSDDDDTDISTTAVVTLQIDVTGAGGRQASDTLTNASHWTVYIISGSGQTTKPFAVKDGSTVTLPTGYTDKAFVGYIYYIDATSGIIDFDHGEDGFIRYKTASEIPENLDTTAPATTWTDVTLSIHSGVLIALLSLVGTSPTAPGGFNPRSFSVRPDGWTWEGAVDADPAPAMSVRWAADAGLSAPEAAAGQVVALRAPGKIIEYRHGPATGESRDRIYTIGFFNGFFIP